MHSLTYSNECMAGPTIKVVMPLVVIMWFCLNTNNDIYKCLITSKYIEARVLCH